MKRALKTLSLAVGVASILSTSPALARGGDSGAGLRSGGGTPSVGGRSFGGSSGSFRSRSRGGHFGGSFRGSPGRFGISSGYRTSSRFHRNHRYWSWGYAPLWASYGWYWGWPYDPWYSSYGRTYGRVYVGSRYGGAEVDSGRYAAVDTDVNPDDAELWLDGKLIGTADDFDGHPDLLYLKPGKYHLEFKLRGHEGYSVDVEAHRGEKIKLDKKLSRLPGVGKLDSFTETSKGTPYGRVFGPGAAPAGRAERGDRDERDGWRSRRSERRTVREDSVRIEANRADDDDADGDGVDGDDVAGDGDVDVKDEPRKGTDGDRMGIRPGPKSDERSRVERPRERADAGRARLKWSVKPEDAAIYLDDRYIGTGEDLGSSSRAFVTEPGKHTITVVRPGYKTRTLEVEATTGESLDVEINLDK